jgi:hypothetical protein
MNKNFADCRALGWAATMIGFAMMMEVLSIFVEFARQLAPAFENGRSTPSAAFDNAGIPYLASIFLLTGTALMAVVVLFGRSSRAERTEHSASRDIAMTPPDCSPALATSGQSRTDDSSPHDPGRGETTVNEKASDLGKEKPVTGGMPMVAHFGGVSDLIELPDGSIEVRVYATRRDALAAGLEKRYVARLFHGAALHKGKTAPCTQLIGPSKDNPTGQMVVACRNRTCNRTCVLYSMPKNGDLGKDWARETGNPIPHDNKRFYKCECR